MKQEETAGTETRRRRMKVFSAKEKSQAVLALWSGRRRASSLMKELGVAWGVLNYWEKSALSGMLSALDPAWKQAGAKDVGLPVRVTRLLEQALGSTQVTGETK